MNAADRAMSLDRMLLSGALLGLAALYALWFRDDRDRIATLLVFALPPLLLAIGVLARRATARFWAGVFALCWFSHGVMVAWAHPEQRVFALIEIVLALAVIFASNAAGLRAKLGRKKPEL
jgi:uncharacterized membrane protein